MPSFKSDRQKRTRALFQWSFKPLNFCLKFVLGFDLNVTARKFSVGVALSFAIIIFYLISNSPCGFYSGILHQKDQERYTQGSHDFAKITALAYLTIVKDVSTYTLFLAIPIIHIAFILCVFTTKNWKTLWYILESIQHSMNFSEKFHRRCQKLCLLALAILLLVK